MTEAMDHTEIADRGWVELYHRGQLTPADEERFEEHFFGCEECQRELELARSMVRGLRTMAAEDAAGEMAQPSAASLEAASPAAAPPAPPPVPFPLRPPVPAVADLAERRARGRWLPLARAAAVTAAVLGLPLLWSLAENDRLAEETRALRQRAVEAERTAAAAGEMLAESERRLAEERARLARRPSAGQEQPGRAEVGEPGEPAEGRLAEARPPSGPTRFATAVLLLSAVRGEANAPPVLDLGSADGPVALAVDIEDDPRFTAYRLTLRDGKGRVLFTQDDVRRNSLETLLVTLPAGFLRSGLHTLTVEGLVPGGAAAEVGRHAFLVQ